MQPVKQPVLDANKTLDETLQQLSQPGIEEALVRLSPSGWGIVSKKQVIALATDGKGTTALTELLPIPRIPFLHPDHPLETALRYVDRWALIPVVNRADFRQLEGVVTQRQVLERYREFGEG
jgi:hypothetical protein